MKPTYLLPLALLLLGTYSHGVSIAAEELNVPRQRIVFSPSGFTIVAEKADSEEKRQRGLMGRKKLKRQEGMIFFFEETAIHAFWMYKTLIPLAVVFVDEDRVVVDVQYMNPCLSLKSDDCPVYVARRPSRFAIEINQDVARRHRIGVGDQIRFEDR